DVIAAFDPRARRKWVLDREARDATGHAYVIACVEVNRSLTAFVVKATRGVDGLGHPVKRDVTEQFVFSEAALHVAVACCPVARLLHDPGRQADRRIVQRISDCLWLGALYMAVSSPGVIPAVFILEERFLNSGKLGTRLKVWAVRSRNVI